MTRVIDSGRRGHRLIIPSHGWIQAPTGQHPLLQSISDSSNWNYSSAIKMAVCKLGPTRVDCSAAYCRWATFNELCRQNSLKRTSSLTGGLKWPVETSLWWQTDKAAASEGCIQMASHHFSKASPFPQWWTSGIIWAKQWTPCADVCNLAKGEHAGRRAAHNLRWPRDVWSVEDQWTTSIKPTKQANKS